MRLIDADDFGHRMYHEVFEKDSEDQRWDSGCWMRYKLFERVLREQPEAQPDLSSYSDKLWRAAYERGKAEARMRGRWIDRNGNIVSPFWERYECSECGARSDNTNYCPNCGSYNGGEQE